MADEVRVGMVGAGMIGQVAHLANFSQIPGCRVTAIAELRPELGAAAARRYGVPALFASHREMLAADAVDAVIVVTRRPATGPVVLDALEAGKHVLSEKPMAHTAIQACRLVDASKTPGRVYTIGFMKRYDAGTALAYRLLAELRASGELGRVLMIRAWCFAGEFACGSDSFVMTEEIRPDGIALWPIAPDWVPKNCRDDYAWFLNVFIHDINLLRHFAGTMPAVRAVDLGRANGRVVLFDCGAFPALLEMGEQKGTAWHEGLEIAFEKGRLTLAFPSPLLKNVPARVTLTKGGETSELATGWSWCFRRQAEAFIADIAGGHESLASGADSVADMELAEAIWRRHLGLDA